MSDETDKLFAATKTDLSDSTESVENQQQAVAPRRGLSVVREHAQGGLGKISIAVDEKLGRSVALKEIKPDRQDDPRLRQRFVTEAEITSRLEHPGIVPVYSMDEDLDGNPYYTMRFIQGQTLGEAIASYHAEPRPRVFRELLQRFTAICQALAYTHSKQVIHRDLKPSNVMLGEFGETLVLDWGLAKDLSAVSSLRDEASDIEPGEATKPGESAGSTQETIDYSPSDAGTDEGLTRVGQVLGTAAYMSPEQAAGRPVTPATDIYALGAILYNILTGMTPYQGSDAAETVSRVIAGPPRRPSELAQRIPKALEAVCMLAMSRTPSDRYTTATELAADVDRWLSDEPVSVYTDPFAVRARRWMRRHRTVVAATAALLVASVIGLTAGIIAVDGQRQQTEVALAGEARRREQTRQALDDMSSQIIDEWLMKQRELTDDHRAFLGRALASYEEFAADVGDDEKTRAGVAAAHQRVGDIRKILSDSAEAEASYRRALGIYSELAARSPDIVRYAERRVAAYHSLGIVLTRNGRRREAEDVYKQAVPLQQQLVDRFPASTKYRSGLAGVYRSLGRVQTAQLRDQDAVESLQRAHDIRAALADESPDDSRFRHEQAMVIQDLALVLRWLDRKQEAIDAYELGIEIEEALVEENTREPSHQRVLGVLLNDLGILHKAGGDFETAEPFYRRSLAIRERLMNEFPSDVEHVVTLSGSYLNLGNLLRIKGQLEDALESYAGAVTLLDPLIERDPRYNRARSFLRNTNEGRGEAHMKLGNYPAALAAWDRAIELNDRAMGMNDPQFDVRLPLRRAVVLVHLRRADEAIEIAERTMASAGKSIGEASYCAAGVFAVAAANGEDGDESEQYVTRAVKLLRQALEEGHKRSGPKGEVWTEDGDFETLRGRSEYQQLVEKHQ